MKKTVLFFFTLFAVVALLAQPRGESPKYNPDLNPYEKILEDTARGKRTARFLKNFLAPEVWRDKFIASPCNDYITLGNTRLDQFNAFVNDFLSQPSDLKQMKAAEENYKKQGVTKIMELVNYEISFLEKQGTFTGNANEPVENLLCRAKGSLQQIKHQLVYMQAVKKVFPGTPGLDEGIRTAKDALAAYPDNKSILALIKGNKNEALREVFLPKPVTQNAEWEGWFKDYFTKNFPGYTLIRQSIQSKDWYVKKNELSGFPEYRQIGTYIGAKGPDGKCYIIGLDIYQDYLGGKFAGSRFDEGGRRKCFVRI